jgi:hypothetical protein
MLSVLLLGCTPQLFVEYDQIGCQDYDFDDPSSEEVLVAQSGADLIVSHTNLITTCDAVFEPELSTDGSILEVREYWTEGSSDCETCLTPQVIIADAPSRSVEVRWYIEDESIPLGVVEAQAE